MAPKKTPSLPPPPIPIGNCQVIVQAKNASFQSDPNSLQITLSKRAKVNISVAEGMNKMDCDGIGRSTTGGKGDCYFLLVNSKDIDDADSKSLLQEVVSLYMKELPAMNYAANTGKKSSFLERCVSNGKYCTLILKLLSSEGPEQVISAITYQIIPSDKLYAEVPLAAVSSIYQLQGVGRLMYMELRRRLQSVGIRTIFCWGDKESEGFWHKQGFVPVGEVDARGRARRLPIKADIRKALCFPGGSTLMVSHLSKDFSANSAESSDLSFPLKLLKKSLTPDVATNQYLEGLAENRSPPNRMNWVISGCQMKQPEEMLNGYQHLIPVEDVNCVDMATGLGVAQLGPDVEGKNCCCSATGSKKRVWEASCTSLKSKKIKGCQSHSKLDSQNVETHCSVHGSSLATSINKPLIDLAPGGPSTYNCLEKKAEDLAVANFTSGYGNEELLPRRKGFRIMLMNIADAAKQSRLIKIIEELGADTTSDGSVCTHVITGKVRKTLNFCTALCSGAWVLSPSWLKESCREGRFVDETTFVLKDEEYELKYRVELKDAVLRAKASPHALLRGYDICVGAHVQPPASTLSTIIRSAGGKVIHDINKVNEASKTIFVASEENMDEALSALKKGMRTFSTDWFMNCIMMQQLDLEAPQFAESL